MGEGQNSVGDLAEIGRALRHEVGGTAVQLASSVAPHSYTCRDALLMVVDMVLGGVWPVACCWGVR